MEALILQALPRSESGTRLMRRLRKSGNVPGVLYGLGRENVMLTLNGAGLKAALSSMARMVNLKWDDKAETVLIKDVQYDPFGREILHVDFTRIDLHKSVVLAIPIELYGLAAGVKDGGVLDHQMKEVKIECLPTAIPEKIRLNVTELGLGSSIFVKDVKIPEDTKMMTDPEGIVVTIRKAEEEKKLPEEEALAEPEVITRKVEKEEEVEEGK
ncbi:MAG TPA: 50S ribosomal protein L25 [Candidatus Brocadiia bacterium]|nr:50S ribosomal protein L25 [Planctomycetota bacterium]MDO8092140.1 50S ribosomal protein L25 [Candidatus Brocadiales bacterium]